MADLYISIYKLAPGSRLKHWALFLDNGEADRRIYQVVGEPTAFEQYFLATVPWASKRVDKNVFVAEVRELDVARLDDILTEAPIDNVTPFWCCQDWVLEGLELLADDGIVDDENGEYQEAIEYVKRVHLGPMPEKETEEGEEEEEEEKEGEEGEEEGKIIKSEEFVVESDEEDAEGEDSENEGEVRTEGSNTENVAR